MKEFIPDRGYLAGDFFLIRVRNWICVMAVQKKTILSAVIAFVKTVIRVGYSLAVVRFAFYTDIEMTVKKIIGVMDTHITFNVQVTSRINRKGF